MLEILNATSIIAMSGRQVVYGFMRPADLQRLDVPDYQREILPVTSVKEWVEAYRCGEVPALDLGCPIDWSERFGNTIKVTRANVIDGLQRISAAKEVANSHLGGFVVPVCVYIGTTEEWEKKRFAQLNGNRRQVGPNVLLRNVKESNAAVAVLYRLSLPDSGTLLQSKVQWTQSPVSGNLLTAVSLLKVAASLHAHLGGSMHDTKVPRLSWALHDVVTEMPEDIFAENVTTFFQVLQAIRDFSRLKKSTGVIQLRLGYLLSLARLFSSYRTFWDDQRLAVTESVQSALADITFDSFQKEEVSSKGRNVDGLVTRMAGVAVKARRSQLEPW